jgi:peptide/nickel transport system ATP-binding protein
MQLKAQGINFKYRDDEYILKDIDFTIESGEVVGLVAPSGFGKTTLAKILAGYEKSESGTVTIDGQKNNKKGYSPVQLIFQHPEKSVNPRWKMDKIVKEAYTPSKELLEDMGIKKEWLNRWPSELSGGELQRLQLAEYFLVKPEIILLDEPACKLDKTNKDNIYDIIENKYNNVLRIVITHDAVIEYKNGIILEMRDGTICQN